MNELIDKSEPTILDVINMTENSQNDKEFIQEIKSDTCCDECYKYVKIGAKHMSPKLFIAETLEMQICMDCWNSNKEKIIDRYKSCIKIDTEWHEKITKKVDTTYLENVHQETINILKFINEYSQNQFTKVDTKFSNLDDAYKLIKFIFDIIEYNDVLHSPEKDLYDKLIENNILLQIY